MKNELANGPAADAPDPTEVLESILGPLSNEGGAIVNDDHGFDGKPSVLAEDVDFGGLSLEEFAHNAPETKKFEDKTYATRPLLISKRRKTSLRICTSRYWHVMKSLKSVETYLTSFRADLASVSTEIESLQNRSTALNNKLQNRKAVEKVLGPEVDSLTIPPAVCA